METDRKDLREERGWVIVSNDRVLEYETFEEASAAVQLLNGNLMSKSYFENHYKNENL
jgi:hypothetical protein